MPVTLETTVDGVVRQHIGEADDDQFVSAAIDTILSGENPAQVLRPILRSYLLGRRRAIVRALEHDAFRPAITDGGGAAAVSASNPAMTERLRPLLTELVWIPGAGKVAWGEATVAQLEARRRMYISQRTALSDAIRDVREAITLIRSVEGATCLNDVLANQGTEARGDTEGEQS